LSGGIGFSFAKISNRGTVPNRRVMPAPRKGQAREKGAREELFGLVNTVGRDEEAIRADIRNQEKEDQRLEQMNLRR
jgi:hypothetical protein